MLDAIKCVVDDSIVFQQHPALVHLGFSSPTDAVQNCQLSFS